MSKLASALAILQQLPSIIAFAESLFPGRGEGQNKKLTVNSKLSQFEGAIALDQTVQQARSALIDAQVAYANAVTLATAQAQALGILTAPPIVAPALVTAPGGALPVQVPSVAPQGAGAGAGAMAGADAGRQAPSLVPPQTTSATAARPAPTAQPLSTARSIRTPSA